ncbi:MAG: TIGR03808 family TAT-translocated repetitive protein [Rhizobiaceae bacterium]|nr:TIGR03808 family TAT-translocated repetitive protein [Rhizobiaceae bacterium]
MLSRRLFLTGAATSTFASAALAPGIAHATGLGEMRLRGSLNAVSVGLLPEVRDPQSRIFQEMLARAAELDEPLFLPAGDYRIANVTLPPTVRVIGVRGATRLIYAGGDFMLAGQGLAHVEMIDIAIDGANLALSDSVEGLLDIRDCPDLRLTGCTITGSSRHGVYLEAVAGRVSDNRLSGAVEAALYSVNAAGLSVTGNVVTDCANGGIWVHRWQPGHDGTQVISNRVERIGSANGGTGQWGNGINVYQADGVMIANNTVSDCAFSAIRSNGGSNVQILGNSCLRSGETAIYSEFKFEGAVINGNIVDGAANGISVANFNEGGRLAVVQGNMIRNLVDAGPYEPDPSGFGIGIAIEADTAVTGNVVEGTPHVAIHIGWGPFMRNVVVTGNVVRQAETGVRLTVVEDSGTAVITDNAFEKISGTVIGGFRWTEQVTGDLANGRGVPSNLTIERNAVS